MKRGACVSEQEIIKDSKGRFVKGVSPWNKGLKGIEYLSHLKEGKTWVTGKKGYIEDKIRTQELKEKGFRVIRLWENKINKMDLKQFKEVLN